MDRTVIPSEHPLDLSHADESLRSRILAGQKAVLDQVGYFEKTSGKPKVDGKETEHE